MQIKICKRIMRKIKLGMPVTILLIFGWIFVFGNYGKNSLTGIENQIEIFTNEVAEWSNHFTGYFCFTVADLNQDGNLELIVSTIEGSGDYSFTNYYVIEYKTVQLMQLQEDECSVALINDFLEGEQVNDGTHRIVDNGITYVPVYYNKNDNIFYYIHHDYSGHTPYEARDKVYSLSLENNSIREELLAYKETTCDEPYSSNVSINYWDSFQNEISEAEYNKISEKIYVNCDKMEMCWKWKRVETKEEVQNMNKEELKKLLMELYENFKIMNKFDE